MIITLKKQPIVQLINAHLIDYPTPSNISYFWNFGFLAGMCLVIQIVTGIALAMHYTPHVDLAFLSLENIMRDSAGCGRCLGLSSGEVVIEFAFKLISRSPLMEELADYLSILGFTLSAWITLVGIASTWKGVKKFINPAVAEYPILIVLNSDYKTSAVTDKARVIDENIYQNFDTSTSNSTQKEKVWVTGEIWKDSEPYVGSQDNESATTINNKKKKTSNTKVSLFEKAISVENLKAAWVQLKSNPGMLTQGSTNTTLNNITEDWFFKSSQLLMKGEYVYPNKKRPLTINDPRTKIIEKALLNVIEPYFEGVWHWNEISETKFKELNTDKNFSSSQYKRNKKGWFEKTWTIPPIFLNSSYGFRPNKSVNKALQTLKLWPSNTVFFLDYDIEKAFDNVNRSRLKNIFLKYLNDTRIWNEISKMMKAGVIAPDLIFEEKGISQGSILSPFLFNVYMHEFDSFMQTLTKNNSNAVYDNVKNIEAKREHNRILNRYKQSNIAERLREFGNIDTVINNKKAEFKAFYEKYKRTSGVDLDTRKILYIRYADDFLIGIVGSKKFANLVKNNINTFIRGNLHLEIKKDTLLHRNEKGAKFLGHIINLVHFKKKVRIDRSVPAAFRKYKRRVLARLRKSDIALGHAASFKLKKNLLQALKIEDNNPRTNKKALQKKATIISTNIFNTNPQHKIDRWVNLIDRASNLKKGLAGKFMLENIKDLELAGLFENDDTVRLIKLRNQFLKGLDEIIADKHEEWITSHSEKAKNTWKKAQSKSKHNVWKEFSFDEINLASSKLAAASTHSNWVRTIGISAPIKDIINNLKFKGFLSANGNPIGNKYLLLLTDAEIVLAYGMVIRGIMNFYSNADNFSKIKSIAQLLRKSCMFTLARKHNKHKALIYSVYGDDATVIMGEGKKITLPTMSQISNAKTKHSVGISGFNIDNVLNKFKIRTQASKLLFS